jgi:RHS repeat-associated protein
VGYSGNRVKATLNGATTAYVGNYYEQTGSAIKKYYYAGSQRIAMWDSTTNAVYYLLGDHLGSTAIAANGTTGALASEQRYKPWGEQRYPSGASTLPTRHRFTGQVEDSEIGLYFYGARMYSSVLGRFLSADSIVPDGKNPQQFNRYSYSLSNPVKYTDPSGHAVDAGGATCSDCWWELYEAYNHVSEEVDPRAYHGHLQPYLAAKGALYYNLATKAAPETIATSEEYLANDLSRLKVSGYFGKEAGWSAAADASGLLGMPLMAIGGLEELGAPGLSRGIVSEQAPPGEHLENTARSLQDAVRNLSGKELFNSLADGQKVTVDEALDVATQFLGEGYRKVAPGVYVAQDGTRMFRMTDSDLLGHSGGDPHVNLELVRPVIEPNGRVSYQQIDNIHLYLIP